MKRKRISRNGWVICVSNKGYPASLERAKVYQSLSDPSGARIGMVRVTDESGEDYLFPKQLFRPIKLAPSLEKNLRRSSRKR